MIFHIYDCVYNLVCMVLFMLLCNSFFEKRYKEKQHIRLMICILWFCIFNILTLVFAENQLIFRLVTTFAFHLVALFLLYKAKIYKMVLILLAMFGLGLCSDYIMFIVYRMYMPGATGIDSVSESSVSLVLGTISLLIQYVLVLIIKRIASSIHYDEFSVMDLLKHIIFPLFSIAVVVILCLPNDDSKHIQLAFLVVLSCLLLLMNVYVFYFMRIETHRKIEHHRSRMLTNHAEEITELYNQSCLDREEQAKRTHEYKNVLLAIEGLLAAGKYTEATEYVKKINDGYFGVANVVNTGNAVVNAVFNTKYSEAVRKGIIVRFDINDLAEIRIEYTDLVTVLANLLNNAIEACEKCDANNRIIIVVIKVINEKELMISIKNTYSGKIHMIKGRYLSTKKDSENHGFGLENVRNVVDKLNGYIDINNDDDFFAVTVVVCYC